MSGTKFDDGKPRIELIDGYALEEIGRVLAFGAEKYGAHNWRRGIATSRLLGAVMRHILAFSQGYDEDPESGLPHLAHAAAGLTFLIWTVAHRPDLDDRWRPE
ncbi:MAG: DUF5664 domain-containing protein [Armatimonadetes bacterium]|nr:DUF5664 domain-containing protein [Armatimonadota bacterium]